MTPALKLAKECGIRDNIHDDAAMDYISNARLETFYQAAWKQTQNYLNQLADELEAQK